MIKPVAVDVGVGVIEPVSVAALGNRNDIVDLIDAVDADVTLSFTASATPTASFPFASAITITAIPITCF